VFDRREPAIYYATVVYTTLGLGDVRATPDWRLMAACVAASGLLLFGLSTAFLFEILGDILRRRRD